MDLGIVIRSTGSAYEVRFEDGRQLTCNLKGNFRIKGLKATNPIAVGDRVEVLISPDKENSLITGIIPRKNYIIRRATKLSKNWHIIAANIDRAYFIVTVVSPRTGSGFIDRLLVTAEAYSIPAALIFNKIDLYDEESKQKHDYLLSIYRRAGYPCFEVSALKGINIDLLKTELQGRVNLFSGHSGVGKSALINALDSNHNLRTGSLSEYWVRGKHTTTFAQMHPLSFGGYIIDTPGIGEFGLLDFGKEELTHYFPELFAILPECKFYNCTHVHEPGCALEKAIGEGRVSLERYGNYLKMLNGEDLDISEWELE